MEAARFFNRFWQYCSAVFHIRHSVRPSFFSSADNSWLPGLRPPRSRQEFPHKRYPPLPGTLGSRIAVPVLITNSAMPEAMEGAYHPILQGRTGNMQDIKDRKENTHDSQVMICDIHRHRHPHGGEPEMKQPRTAFAERSMAAAITADVTMATISAERIPLLIRSIFLRPDSVPL